MRLIAATSNPHKLSEIRSMLKSATVLGLQDIGYYDEIVEDGSSFFENASIKANAIRKIEKNALILADDSGLEVDFLRGAPGIYSARYAGENATQEDLINKLLSEMKGVPKLRRSARFVCTMVLILPNGKTHAVEGICGGRISNYPKGENGFGYDPVFLAEDFGFRKTLAQLSAEEKNQISHRSRALKQMTSFLLDREEETPDAD